MYDDPEHLYDHRPEWQSQPRYQVFAKKALRKRYDEILKSMPPNASQLDVIIELIEDNNARLYSMFMEHEHP